MSTAEDIGSTRHGLPESDDAISRALVSARLSATPLNEFPGVAPDSMDQAYAIQAASISRWPDSVAGWKVGLLSPPDQKRYSTERLAGPIFRSQVHEVSTGSRIAMPIFVGGFAAVEAEFVFRFGKTVEPNDRQWSDEALAELVAGLHIGAEIASSPMAEINNLGPTVVTADFGNNAGLVLGPEIPDWQSMTPADLPARVIVDGDTVGEASAAAIRGGPIAALRFLVTLSADLGIELPAGTLVSTGASTGIHDVETASRSRVEFGGYGWFEVTFEPVSQRQ
ncbi:MAG: fumarylacetoacetate hydrolase family protein [Gammaproteobacteria bacterium]|nr:fumarylacetoacetate hydrolase family protein [Gammaproteobacteria bacterium]